MRTDNLDLFNELMRQGKIKAQIDAEDKASEDTGLADVGKLIVDMLLDGRSPSEGVDVHVVQNDTKYGLGVSMNGSLLGLSMATTAVVDAFFDALDNIYKKTGNEEAKKFITMFTINNILESISRNMKK